MRIVLIAAGAVLTAGSLGAMFYITFAVEQLEARPHDLSREIAGEKETNRVLKQENGYLNMQERGGTLPAGSRYLPPVMTLNVPTFRLLRHNLIQPRNVEGELNLGAYVVRPFATERPLAVTWPVEKAQVT
ncbi:MAG: hypothetical protein VX430_00830 [Pseudomonadota bacterium]|nr:hypothetical protein [Pseudomonadota bacterium]